MKFDFKYIPFIKKAYKELVERAKEDLMSAVENDKAYAMLAKNYRELYKGNIKADSGEFEHMLDPRFLGQFHRSMQEFASLFEFNPNSKSAHKMQDINDLIVMITELHNSLGL